MMSTSYICIQHLQTYSERKEKTMSKHCANPYSFHGNKLAERFALQTKRNGFGLQGIEMLWPSGH